jgi:hypothetical protein
MSELTFVLAGTDTDAAADHLSTVLDDGRGIASRRLATETSPDDDRRVVDPIAVASLIVSVPAAVLAVADIVDRIQKRRKAQSVIEAAKRIKADRQVETYVLLADRTPRAVAELDADQLLDLIAEIDPPSDPGRYD